MKRNSYREGGWPEPTEPLPSPVLDSHTHIDLQEIEIDAALAAAFGAGVLRVVQVGTDLESSRWGAELARQYGPGLGARTDVLATVALHPNEAPRLAAHDPAVLTAALAAIDELAALPYVHGVGETGLDYFRTEAAGRAAQRASFYEHIEIAKRRNKTLVIHDRDAHEDVFNALSEVGAPERVIFHCFSGDADFARRCVERGYFLSFAGNITFKNAAMLREAALVTPLENILVETDGPFLTPMPYRGKPNGPYLIPITVRFLATLRGDDIGDICAAIWANGERAFGITPAMV